MTSNEFIKCVSEIAVKDWLKRRIMLPSVVIAQAILESGWGGSELATKANALFGIKKNGWTGKTYVKAATEQRPDGTYYVVDNTEWRAYDNWSDSIVDHNNYIATREVSSGVLRYKAILGNTDVKAVCELLRSCGYATSLTYPEKLLNLINQYNLTQYDTTEEVTKMLKIAIDAGHGLNTAGKRVTLSGYPDTREWTLNSRIANKLEQLLKSYNCQVLRVDDTTGNNDISNTGRANKANEWNADVYIAIHHDAGLGGRAGGGTTVYWWSNSADRPKQAQSLYDCVIAQTGLKGNRSSKVIKKDFTVIARTNMAAFLIENGFMDSPTDVPVILSEEHANKTAQGLLNFLIKEFKLERVNNSVVYYRVQVGAFIAKEKAENLANKLKAEGYEVVVVSG